MSRFLDASLLLPDSAEITLSRVSAFTDEILALLTDGKTYSLSEGIGASRGNLRVALHPAGIAERLNVGGVRLGERLVEIEAPGEIGRVAHEFLVAELGEFDVGGGILYSVETTQSIYSSGASIAS